MNEKTLVDFIARGERNDEWRMVLVEEGPWSSPVENHLIKLQNRLYGCLDAALDGMLVDDFPESKGKCLVIQIDCYNLNKSIIEPFFRDFSSNVLNIPDYSSALKENPFVKQISFEINFDNIH
jgi:hypothetical protein